ncbi:hypothetical protein [Paraburkholderia hospita]|uniref:hypothetical protein n=1 Tax=Paraburkholderia hospita TaxID=169430 RepID=UPI0008A72AB4|nr:hypothetical protein [Paraburkholderia hospita]SEH89330.1 hypothetical protein SAMN05192544_1011116 [Paraburkholderia hospita]
MKETIRALLFVAACVAFVIAAVVLAVVVSPVAHAETKAPAVCEAGAALAESTARLRDHGVSLAEVRAQMVDSNAPDNVLDAMLTLADAVYNEPKLTPREARRAFMHGCTKPATKGSV